MMTEEEKTALITQCVHFARKNHKQFLETEVMKETLFTENDLIKLVHDFGKCNWWILIK